MTLIVRLPPASHPCMLVGPSPLLQVPALGRIDANDMDKDAVAAIGRNVALNGGAAADKIRVLCSDARMTMLGANQVGGGCQGVGVGLRAGEAGGT